jgi:hypothetical protein
MDMSVTPPHGVSSIMRSCKAKASGGYDEITTPLPNACSCGRSTIPGYLCNPSVLTGTFPDWLTAADIRPLVTKGGTEIPSNYRPISLLPAFPHIIEKVMYRRLLTHFATNGILSRSRFGFLKGSDIEKAVYTFGANVRTSLDDTLQAAGIVCGLSKAFDCVAP